MKTFYETKDGRQFTTKAKALKHEKSLKNIKYYPIKFIKVEDYEMQVTPVTQYQWEKIMGNNPSYFKDKPNNPVEAVSYDNVQTFISILNFKDKKYSYRLPTEQEWEHCAKSCVDGEGWHWENSNNSTQPVAKLKPNKLGFYDMLGNVWEWTDSLYDSSGSYCGMRGGGWYDFPQFLRPANRYDVNPGYCNSDVGFRLVRTLR